jgi:tRNA1(Val) A37 N6-methylase TrmN6
MSEAYPLPSVPETGGTVPDDLLGGRVRLYQPETGYRVAVDPVLLAAFTDAQPGEHVLDIGTGTGAAALCLAARVPSIRLIGLEAEGAMADTASRNVELNSRQSHVIIMRGDLLRPPPALGPSSFDRVMMNPPYLKAGAASVPPDPLKAAANVEGEARLGDWINFAAVMLKARGTLTIVHRADRIDEILALLHSRFGAVTIHPVWPRAGEAAKRVLVKAVRGARTPATLAAGLVLHDAAGHYTPEAEWILRDGGTIPA